MFSYREIATAFVNLQIPYDSPVIVHGSLSSFGEVKGGSETILGALSTMSHQVMFPSFTYKTMIIPNDGPPDNGLTYGSSADLNLMAEFYNPEMPVDPLIGVLAERFRTYSKCVQIVPPNIIFCRNEYGPGHSGSIIIGSLCTNRTTKQLEGMDCITGCGSHR